MKKLKSLFAFVMVMACMFVATGCFDFGGGEGGQKLDIDVTGNYNSTTLAETQTYLNNPEVSTDISTGYKAYIKTKTLSPNPDPTLPEIESEVEAYFTVLFDNSQVASEMLIEMKISGAIETESSLYYKDNWVYFLTKTETDTIKYKQQASNSELGTIIDNMGVDMENLLSVEDCIDYITAPDAETMFTVELAEEGTTKKFKINSTANYTYGTMNFYLIFDNNVFSGLDMDSSVEIMGMTADIEMEMIPFVGTITAPDLTDYTESNPEA